jgi:hypothetical protein
VISTGGLNFICAKMNRHSLCRVIQKRCPLRQGKMLMQANEVMLIGALALFAAFAMGWCMHWLWMQLLRGSLPSIEAMSNVTQELLNATAQRDAAREEVALKEAELINLLAQARAERDAAMEGLRQARISETDRS